MNKHTSLGGMLTVADLAKELGFCKRTITEKIKSGEICGFKFRNKGKWYVRQSELERYKKEGGLTHYIGQAESIDTEKPQVSKTMLPSQISATDSALKKHWNKLSTLAEKFVSMWLEYFEAGTFAEGYHIVDVDSMWFESFTNKNGYMANKLLRHLKAEFPKEFGSMSDWLDLLKYPLPEGGFDKLRLVAERKTFKGTCDICQGWLQP